MDFSLSEEQEATRDLARQILSDRETHEHLKELEAGGEGFDRDTWAELAKAGLLGIALPEDAGGSGLGFVALCRLFEEIGRTVAPVPVLPTVVLGALPIAQFGTEFYLEAFRLMFEVVGQPGYLKQDAPDSVLKSRLERYYRSLIILTFGGGVNEVQRDLIAVFGLGMPMAKR